MKDLVWFSTVMLVSGWCNFFHKKHHQEIPEMKERWCAKCECYYTYRDHM